MINLIDAIQSLVPNAEVCTRGDEIEWLAEPINKPSSLAVKTQYPKR